METIELLKRIKNNLADGKIRDFDKPNIKCYISLKSCFMSGFSACPGIGARVSAKLKIG